MLFWLFVIILCVAFGLLYLDNHYCVLFENDDKKHPILNRLYHNDVFSFGGAILIVISIIGIGFSLFAIVGNHVTADSYIARSNERYEALCYKVKTENAIDDFGLRNKEIIDEIQEWNEEIVEHQTLQDDFWIGIYFPNVYDQFETIPLE